MLDKIIEIFFDKKKKANNTTAVSLKKEAMPKPYEQKKNKHEIKTCLSEYFCNLKGLNVKERERFYSRTFSVLYNRQESVKSGDFYR